MKQRPTDGGAGDNFGCAVSLEVNHLVIGAYGYGSVGFKTGAAYVYHRCYGGGWGLVAKLLGPAAFLRFMPAHDYSGTVANGLTFRAWDQTSGTEGSQVIVLFTGGKRQPERDLRDGRPHGGARQPRVNWIQADPGIVDGGALEFRRPGEPWWDIIAGDGTQTFATSAYNQEVPPSPSHPLSSRNIWSGTTSNWFQPVVLALDSRYLAGQTVQFRWRVGATAGAAGRGWYVDNVKLGMVPLPNRPPSGIVLNPSSVPENQPAGTVVGTLAATDPDPADTHTYQLCAGAGDQDNPAFVIVGSLLKTAAVLDYETKPTLTVRIRVVDGTGAAFEEPLLVSVLDQAIEDTDGDGFTDLLGPDGSDRQARRRQAPADDRAAGARATFIRGPIQGNGRFRRRLKWGKHPIAPAWRCPVRCPHETQPPAAGVGVRVAGARVCNAGRKRRPEP